MTERGEYRAIRRVLLDGPDFQQLSERARWVFVALKLNLGPAGIEVWYPAELAARLSAQTGCSLAAVQDALMTLEKSGWIERERNIIWVIGQLEHDPHISRTDPKHRKMLARHVEGLPRLAIVARFVRAHKGWFAPDDDPFGGPYEALLRTIEGPSEGHRSTENKPENKPEPESLGSSGDDPPELLAGEYPPEFRSVWLVYPKRTGGNPKRDAHAAWRARLRAGVPVEVLHAGVERYAAFCDAEGMTDTRFVMQGKTFFGPSEHYLEAWEPSPASTSAPIKLRDGWFAEAM